MLKRTLILLCIAGGLLGGVSIPGSSQASFRASLLLEDPSGIEPARAQAVLKIAGPQMGLAYVDAWTAYTKGEISITESANSGDGSLYNVQSATDNIWVIIIDDL